MCHPATTTVSMVRAIVIGCDMPGMKDGSRTRARCHMQWDMSSKEGASLSPC